MDIYEYLKLDHEKVAHLFKQFEKSKLEERQEEIVALIEQELLVHAESEQATFYKTLEEFPETKEMAQHGEKEHREIKQQMKTINASKTGGKKWHNAVLKLKEIVEHHVKEEEGEIFKKAKKVLTEEEAWILKEQMHHLKGELLLALEKKASKVSA